MTVNWLGIIGKVDVSDGVISHVPVLAETATQLDSVSPQEPVSLAKSNIEFEAGTIFFEVFLQEPKNSCQLVLNADQETQIFAGLNIGNSVVRGDDPNLNGPIIDDITRSIRESSIVIADITPDNPNVFYEVVTHTHSPSLLFC